MQEMVVLCKQFKKMWSSGLAGMKHAAGVHSLHDEEFESVAFLIKELSKED